jgi:1,4-dihydroxy-2-naphthoate octaprenyltransferase
VETYSETQRAERRTIDRMNATRNRIAHGMIWALGAVLGAISSIVLLIAAAVPAVLGLGAVCLAQIRALLRRLGRADA